jgi:SAM-dependent methyltransferase
MSTDTAAAPEDYLATGFAHVDARRQVEPFAACLTLLDSLPYFRAYKERSYELLELHAGQAILEVGCGLGDDLRRMAQQLGDTGRLVGVDASLALLEQARTREQHLHGLYLRTGGGDIQLLEQHLLTQQAVVAHISDLIEARCALTVRRLEEDVAR